jgi:hypothetical protein
MGAGARSQLPANGPAARQAPQSPAARAGWKDAPVVRQLNPNGATADNYRNGANNCAPAAAATLARMLGTRSHQTDAELINDLARGRTTAQGTTPSALMAMVHDVGARPVGMPMVGGYKDEAVRAHLAKGHKVIAQLGVGNAKTGKMDAHYVILDGVDGKGGYRVKDPLRGDRTMSAMEVKHAFLNAPKAGGILMPVAAGTGDSFGAAPRFSADPRRNDASFGQGPRARAQQHYADVTVSLLSGRGTKLDGQKRVAELLEKGGQATYMMIVDAMSKAQNGGGQKLHTISLNG